MKPIVSRRREIIKIRSEISEIEKKKTEEINKTKSWFFENINKIDKLLARLTKKKRNQMNKIIDERGTLSAETTEIHSIIRDN